MPKSFLITNKRYVSPGSSWLPPSEQGQSSVTPPPHDEDEDAGRATDAVMQQQQQPVMTSSPDGQTDVEIKDREDEQHEVGEEEDLDDVDLTSPSLPVTSSTARHAKEAAVKSPLSYTGPADYCHYKVDSDRALPTYFPVPFHCQQRLLTPEERLLLPLVHSILIQRQQQLQQLHAASFKPDESSLPPHSLDGATTAAAAVAQQTSPAGPVGASGVDVSPSSAAAAVFPCGECGRAYSTPSNLARHRQSHRPGPVNRHGHGLAQRPPSPTSPPRVDAATGPVTSTRKCPHCDKVYASAPAYSMHVRTHSQGCECPQCGKRFSRPWLLQGHIRTHTGEKPFRCPHCGKTFADKSNLRAHIQTHSTDKPHVCGRCGKAFALRSYLYKHEESSCMRSHRLYHGYAFLHHQRNHHHYNHSQQQQPPRQRQPSPAIRSSSISHISCQL